MTIENPPGIEIDEAMPLLREYTERLRQDCDEIEAIRSRVAIFAMSSMVAGLVAAGTIAIFLITSIEQSSDSSGPPPRFTAPYLSSGSILAATILGGSTLLFGLMLTVALSGRIRRLKRRVRTATTSTARAVERLVDLISQYHERSREKYANRLRVELQLAESEAAISVFRELRESMHDGPTALRIVKRVVTSNSM